MRGRGGAQCLLAAHPDRRRGVGARPGISKSFAAKQVVEVAGGDLLADGMACRKPDADALAIILANVSRIVEVTDAELASAMRAIFAYTHNVAEGAGAAAFAAAWRERESLAGQRVASRSAAAMSTRTCLPTCSPANTETMKIADLPFGTIDWDTVERTTTQGKRVRPTGARASSVTCAYGCSNIPQAISPTIGAQRHFLLCLEGELETELADGRRFT